MIEMDDLHSAKWQKSRERDIDVILKILNEEKTNVNSYLLQTN